MTSTSTPDTRFDIDLEWKDVLDLADADGVAAFFARLRYNIDVRTKQTPETLGISEAVARPIERVELIAGDESFQVYLFELKSVTVTARRNLARAFRNRAGNFLFVLTSDYDRIDFVLLDRSIEVEEKKGPQSKSPSVRPRTLTIERRKMPNPLHLRLLRRLTWTESDPFYQFEKLQAAWGLVEWGEEEGLFNNRALFSDYYLKHRLPADPVWKDDPRAAFDAIRQLFVQANTNYSGKPEVELREELFVPLFDILGFRAVEKREKPDDFDEPDYLLYAGDSDDQPLAAALTYPWLRFLDGKDEQRDRETHDENPGAAVVSVLEKGEVPWVIVTNGKIWRLYSREAHSKATSWYEIDLEDVAMQSTKVADPRETIRYFWLLFRREAFESVTFVREEKEETLPWLDKLLIESEDYAKELGEKLKARVFEQVFPSLARGFIAEWDGDITEEDLARTYRATLTLLYRLLFLLYAEARDLLPVRELRGYYEKSLDKLKKDVADAAGSIDDEIEESIRKRYKAGSCDLYERLREIFETVDRGSSDLNVPYYNGGLFLTDPADDDASDEAEAARFLRDHAVPDRELALALDLLTRDEDDRTHDRVFIDYKSLGVRHLGSIYEGLLEFRLRIATQKLGIVRKKGRDVYEPFRKLGERKKSQLERSGKIISKGALYLENDKHERKATGSYYTPDHIVEYIVEHAVGPVVEEKLEALRPKLREAQKWHADSLKLARSKGESLSKYEYGPAVEDRWGRLIDEVFDVKVLDPAMGSGHFLVEAVDFITDKILDFLNAFPWNPVTAHLRSTRETILKEMDRQEITIDPGRLTDVSLLKRHVLKRCIYGVDLNPMAVELAKVSLWLDCFTLGAPLSFLNHHLRCGNSLIGSSVGEVDEVRTSGGQLSLTASGDWQGLQQAVEGMIAVGTMPDVTEEQLSSSVATFSDALDAVDIFKRVVDFPAAREFVLFEREKTDRAAVADIDRAIDTFLRSGDLFAWAHGRTVPSLEGQAYQDLAKDVEETSRLKRFFHWELEFPELWWGSRKNDRGFDAIIGNPPYEVLASAEIGRDIADELRYFERNEDLAPAMGGKKNLYKLFITRSLRLLNDDGILSMIVPMVLMGDAQALGVRKLLLSEHGLRRIEVFPQKDDPNRRVFREAKLATCVFVVAAAPADDRVKIRTHPARTIEHDSPMLCIKSDEVRLLDPGNLAIASCSQRDWDIAMGILKRPGIQRLGEFAESFQGEVNETNERKRGSFTDDLEAPLALRGANITLYAIREASQGEDLRVDVKKFLKGKGKTTKAYAHQYERVGFQRSSPQNNFRRLIAAPLPKGSFCLDTVSYVTTESSAFDLRIIEALLNSVILDWLFRLTSTNSKVNEYQYNALPIPTIDAERRGERAESYAGKSIPGALAPEQCSSIQSWIDEIHALESERVLSRRSDRSGLGSEAREIQDRVDSTLFEAYGVSDEEAEYIRMRRREMM